MARKKVRSRKGGRGGRASNQLATVSVELLHAELERRRRAAGPLIRRRALLAEKLAALDAHITALGLEPDSAVGGRARRTAGPARRGGPRRGRRSKGGVGLVETLHTVLTGKEMGVAEAARAVLEAGYKTASKNFRTVVNQTLLVNKDKFRNIARGKYTAK